MKILPWIIAAASLGAAVYVMANTPSTQLAGMESDIAKAAKKSGSWGAQQRLSGTGGELIGKLKKGAGEFTGDQQLKGEGVSDQAAGAIKDTAGKAAQGESLHDLDTV